jgi:hypothetical protein
VQDAHPCTVSARSGAALASARLVDDLSSLVAVAGSGSPQGRPAGAASVPSSPGRRRRAAAPRAGTILMVRRGQSPSVGSRSGEQWTANPLIVPARYNFLYPSSRPACGRPPAAAVLGRQTYGRGVPWLWLPPATHRKFRFGCSWRR